MSPTSLQFTAVADSPDLPPGQIVHVTSPDGNVPFGAGAERRNFGKQPAFVSVNPSSGTTPADVKVALILSVVLSSGPSNMNLPSFPTPVDFGTPSGGGVVLPVTLTLLQPPPPKIMSIVNGASFRLGAVGPREVVTIRGENLGALANNVNGPTKFPDGRYYYDTVTGSAFVTFNGVRATMLYASPNQVNAIVPYEVADQTNAQVILTHYSRSTDPFTVQITNSSPAIFTVDQSGSGQGTILNQDNAVKSAQRPAPAGSVIQIFATGAGLWTADEPDGLVQPPLPTPLLPVTVTIAGQPAQVLYAGPAPGLVSGVLQVNAVLPAGVTSGAQAVVLNVGSNKNTRQQVAVAVQ